MKREFLLTFLLLVGLSTYVFSQDATVSGKVTDKDGVGLPGVTVIIKGTVQGTSTDVNGAYTLKNVPSNATLVFSYVGMKNQEVAAQATLNITMQESDALDEVIVTGVSIGTPTKKLGFSVAKVSSSQLEKVPAVDPGNALRSKAAGVRILQPTGLPGSAPAIRLRGSNSINSLQSPLIIVDGIITGGGLANIDMQSVESIEIIKGAAAASLYGSLAGNGVMQIFTKQGSGQTGKARFTYRTELGFQQLVRKISLSKSHNFQVIDGSYRNGTTGVPNGADPADNIMDNPYDQLFDNQDRLFNSGVFATHFFSAGYSGVKSDIYASYENNRQTGIVPGLPDFQRNNVRLNLSNQLNDKLRFTSSVLYSKSDGPQITNNVQAAGNFFYGSFLIEPDTDLKATNPDGTYIANVRSASNASNPLYQLQQRSLTFTNDRLLAQAALNYQATKWLRLEGRYAIDRTTSESTTHVKKGTLPNNPTNPINPGFYAVANNTTSIALATFRAYLEKKFGDLRSSLVLSYLDENRTGRNNFSQANALLAQGVPSLSNADVSNLPLNAGSGEFTIKARNYGANLILDYKDRYILDASIRNDGLSLFGADVRNQIYFRTAFAYRLSEDFKIPHVNELKLRASYGTSGQRPNFNAQYETYNVTSAGITKGTKGNSKIKPSNVAEFETGLNAILFNNLLDIEFNYATTNARDQFLQVPLSAAQGFTSQWQNAGTLQSNTIELAIRANIFRKKDFTWNVAVNFDRIRQQITQLNRPPYSITAGAGSNQLFLFRIEEGQPFGTMYGNNLLTSLDQLTVVNGVVMNAPAADGTFSLAPSDFEVNSDGYVIQKGTQYTANEVPLYQVDNQGNKITESMGVTTPDFNVGFATTIGYKGFSLYALLDWQQGGRVYNYTKQLLYFNQRHGDQDQASKPVGQRKWDPYYSQHLYNAANPSSHFVEDGTFLKVREISLSYLFSNAMIKRFGLGKFVHNASLSVSGRNLFTVSGYTGYDPEVSTSSAVNSSPTNFRVDNFVYPNFRTYSASLKVTF